MAVKDIIAQGIGFGSVIFVVTHGFGSLAAVISEWTEESETTGTWSEEGAASSAWTPEDAVSDVWAAETELGE